MQSGAKRRGKPSFLKRRKNTRLCDHLSCSRCASCRGRGAAGVQRARLLWRNLTRPRKSSAAYSTQRSGLIASLAFPVTKSHPSATQGRDHDNRQLAPFLCLLLWETTLTVEQQQRTAQSLCRAATLSMPCLSLLQTLTHCWKTMASPPFLFFLICFFSYFSPAWRVFSLASRDGEKREAAPIGEPCTVCWAPRRRSNASQGGSKLHLHVNQQLRGPQVTEIEQWPALAKNRSGEARGLEQHWCV